MSNRKFYALFMLVMMILAVMMAGGCGGSSNNLGIVEPDPTPTPIVSPDPTPTPEPSGYTVVFDSQGGSYVESQTVDSGLTASVPDSPEKDSCHFMGWYTEEGFSFMFDFRTPISRDITLYAKWYDTNDTADSDGDGLPDGLEMTYGTDPYSRDTDDDGLTDFEELSILNYNPLVKDTDGNGILDGDEDPDNDRLTNIQESNYGTNMTLRDTDFDTLSDYDEVTVYGTDPLNPDTDGDGVNDGTEIKLGSNPLVAETVFETSDETSLVADGNDDKADISVKMKSSSEAAGTLRISNAGRTQNIMITPSIPGYISAYELSADSEIISAEITFTLGNGLNEIGEAFMPTIYYFNEESGLLEELGNQRIDGRKITAEVSHFSVYLLLNKVAFDEVWSRDIKPPVFDGNSTDGVLDIAFVIDVSGSMSGNDPQYLTKTLTRDFIGKMREDKDQAAIVTFTSSYNVLQGLTTDRTLLEAAVDRISYWGGTYIRGGLQAALNLLKASDSGYQYIILLTDGDDGYSYASYSNFMDEAKSNDVTIYTIGMGDAKEEVLKSIATDSGGKYYKVTTGTEASADKIMDLNKIFEEIESETVDLTKDDNQDGIPDYYAGLLNSGKMRLSNGTTWLTGVLDMYGDSADWDGDGLKNGEEVLIRTDKNGKVYAYMVSDPLLKDSDFDGYSDYEEVKSMNTSPTKYTMPAPDTDSVSAGMFIASARNTADIGTVSDDSRFPKKYLDFSRDEYWSNFITVTFFWAAREHAFETITNYFYEYSTSQNVQQNTQILDSITEREQAITWLEVLSDVVGMLSSVADLKADDIDFDSTQVGRQLDVAMSSGNTKSANTLRVKKDVLDALNAAKVDDDLADKSESVLSVVKDGLSWTDSIKELADSVNISNLAPSIAKTITGLSSIGISMVNAYDNLNGIELGGWKYGTQASGILTIIGDGLNVIIETKKTVNMYAKIQANFAEYQKCLSTLQYISTSGNFPWYIRGAAQDAYDAVSKGTSDWKKFEDEVGKAKGKKIVLGTLQTIWDAGLLVATTLNPIVGLYKAIFELGALGFKILGVEKGQKTVVAAEMYYGIVQGSKRNLSGLLLRQTNTYFEYRNGDRTETRRNLTHLSQARILGVYVTMDYLLNGSLAGVIDRDGLSENQVRTSYQAAIDAVYDFAKRCKLNLSDNLPK